MMLANIPVVVLGDRIGRQTAHQGDPHSRGSGIRGAWGPDDRRGRRVIGRAQPRSDRVELPGDVVGDAPEIADVGLADERIGAALVPPIEQVDVLPLVESRLDVGLLRGRRSPGSAARSPCSRSCRQVAPPAGPRRRQAGRRGNSGPMASDPAARTCCGRLWLIFCNASRLSPLGRHVDRQRVAGADDQLVIAGRVVEPGVVCRRRGEALFGRRIAGAEQAGRRDSCRSPPTTSPNSAAAAAIPMPQRPPGIVTVARRGPAVQDEDFRFGCCAAPQFRRAPPRSAARARAR